VASVAALDQIERISAAARIDVAGLLLNASDDDVVRTDRAQIATYALSIVGTSSCSTSAFVRDISSPQPG